MTDAPEFAVITAPEIRRCIDGARTECVDIVRRAYLAHHEGRSVLPHSSFLRLPERPQDRIIGLPGYLGGETSVAGIKWISSWPGNPARGRPRASAVLVLNDTETGFAFACLESSLISATRTAASAVLAAEALARDPGRACVSSPFGLGVLDLAIGRWVYDAVRDAGGGVCVGGFFAETDLGRL